MKNYTLLLIALFTSSYISAQIIDIPDANFKNALVNTNCVDTNYDQIYDSDVDTNNDGEIQISEAEAVPRLNLYNQSISSLEGIEFFTNLEILNVRSNQITNLNLNSITSLMGLTCSYNQITELNISPSPDFGFLDCSYTLITELDISPYTNLGTLYAHQNQLETLIIGEHTNLLELSCFNNQLTEIDLSGVPNVIDLFVHQNQLNFLDLSNNINIVTLRAENNQIETLILKNGVINDTQDGYESDFNFSNNPLNYICVDSIEYDIVYNLLELQSLNDYEINSYCSFVPGGEYYTVEGTVTFDQNTNGCDITDPIAPQLNLSVTNGTESGNFISDAFGDYSIPVQEGSHTITPNFENPNYFSVSPISISVSFPTDASPFIQDFCITPNGVFNDLEITIIPIEAARPGFDTDYKVVYKNKGTTTLSGNINFGFEDEVMTFVSSTPPNESGLTDLLSWSFTDLLPFESREINLTMNLNAPTDTPPLNDGDILTFNTSIAFSGTDETPDDNTFELNQTVVNSFDPNDKTCLEGAIISPDMVGKYVHYMIRFENTGSANAINIVVKDHIDITKYDLSSLVSIDASHDYVANIKDDVPDHFVEFIFENINLPFDDANNDGYIAFKIKTLDTLVLGDTFENEAEIYFDFNFPIITDISQTTVAVLSTDEFELDATFSLYPNPTTDVLRIEANQQIQSLNLYDLTGRLVQKITEVKGRSSLEISTKKLSAGSYFVQIQTTKNTFVKQVIKK